MNNGNLKIKVSNGSWVIELEGDEKVVTREFEKIKADGLGKVSELSSVNFVNPESAEFGENMEMAGTEDIKNTGTKSQHIFDDITDTTGTTDSQYEYQYDSLKNVVLKHLPGPEAEWVLVYAYYLSNLGKNKFDRNALLMKYEESGRATVSRKSNLYNNIKICIDKNLLRALNDDEFIMVDAGIKKAKEILSRTSAGKQRKTAKRKTDAGKPEPTAE